MLKSQQSRHYFKEGVMARLSGSAMVIVIGTLAFAAGGVTQSLGREQVHADKEEVRVARSESRKSNSETDPTPGMFQRQVTDPGVIPENDSGMVKVRIADIFQRPDALPLELMINRYSAGALKRLLESPELPDFDIRSVSMMLGTTQLETRHHPNTDRPQKNSLQLGVSDFIVRFSQPANVGKWMEDFAPAVETTQENGRTIYKLPPMPAIGPLPISFVVVDEQTIGFSTKMVDLQLSEADSHVQTKPLVKLAEHKPRPNKSAWANAFRRVDGGLFAYAVTNQGIRTPEEFASPYPDGSKERIAAEAFHRVEHSFETLAIGLDLDQAGDHVGVRIRVGFSQRTDADRAAKDIRMLHRFARERLEDPEAEAGDDGEELFQEFSKQYLERIDDRCPRQRRWFLGRLRPDLLVESFDDGFVRTVHR